MSLKKKIIRGGIWNGIAQFGSQGINFILILILANLLSPKDFGLLGMVTVITGFLGYFSECGLMASLIKKKEIDELDCNTVFWSGIVFGILIYILIYFISPSIAWFYNQPELTDIARVVALIFIIGSYRFVPFALEQKRLHYNKLSVIRLISLLVSGGIAILFAFRGAGVWALVYQQIAMQVMMLLGTLFWITWKPKFQFSYLRFKELLGFGLHVTANNFIKFFSENIDYLLVGKLLGSEALGIYTMAFRLSRYPIEKVSSILGNMLMPAFSIMQDNPDQIRRNMLRVSAFVAMVTIPFLLFLFFSTQEIVILVVGKQWLESVFLIKIFIIYLLFLSFSFADEPVLMIKGKIKTLNLIKLFISLVLLFSGYFVVQRYGMVGMAIIYSLLLSLYYIILKIITLKIIKVSCHDYIQSMRKVNNYAIMLFCVSLLIWLYNIRAGEASMIFIASGLIVSIPIMIIFYFRIINFNPISIKINHCLNIEHNKESNPLFVALGLFIIIGGVLSFHFKIIPPNTFQIQLYQLFIELWR